MSRGRVLRCNGYSESGGLAVLIPVSRTPAQPVRLPSSLPTKLLRLAGGVVRLWFSRVKITNSAFTPVMRSVAEPRLAHVRSARGNRLCRNANQASALDVPCPGIRETAKSSQ